MLVYNNYGTIENGYIYGADVEVIPEYSTDANSYGFTVVGKRKVIDLYITDRCKGAIQNYRAQHHSKNGKADLQYICKDRP